MRRRVKVATILLIICMMFVLSACSGKTVNKAGAGLGNKENGELTESESMDEEDTFKDKFLLERGADFSEGVAVGLIYTADEGERYAVIDKEQNILFELPYTGDSYFGMRTNYDPIEPTYKDGMITWRMQENDKVVQYDKEGKIIDLLEIYDYSTRMGNGYYYVEKNPSGYQVAETQGAVINNKGEEVIPFSEELVSYADDGEFGDGVILWGKVCVSGEKGKVITVDSKYGRLLAKRGERLISEGGIFDLDGNLIAEYYPDYSHRNYEIYVSDSTIVLIGEDAGLETKVYDFDGNLIAEEYLPDVDIEYVGGKYSGGYCAIALNGSDGAYVTMLDEMGKFAFEPIKVAEISPEGWKMKTVEGKLIYMIDEATTGCIDGSGKILFTIDVPWGMVNLCSDGCIGFRGNMGYNYVNVEKGECIFDYDSELVHFMK